MSRFLHLSMMLLLFLLTANLGCAQELIQNYESLQNDSIRIGVGDEDFFAFIQKGFTLKLPEQDSILGVLIFLEDSGYDEKNSNARLIYPQATEAGFAVLSVSSDLPFDFYFGDSSIRSTNQLIQQVFSDHNLPNQHIFFLGGSLVGHRALRYIKVMQEESFEFKLNIDGLVLCHFTMDWTRKWHQHERDIRINKIDLWEPRFINYMLESYLEGSPAEKLERYDDFSAYTYFGGQNVNIKWYKDYAVRAYIQPKVNDRLEQQFRTLYENNAVDMVGFLAELQLAGNEDVELIQVGTEGETVNESKASTCWELVDKEELMLWILQQMKARN